MGRPQEDQTPITFQEQTDTGRTCSKCNLRLPATVQICPNDGTRLVDVPSEGKLLFGKYQFLGVIGQGGMSVVYKARHPDLNKVVAVKMLHSHLVSENSSVAPRFQQEARAVSQLNHRNVISVTDFGSSDQGQPYMVMDYLEGDDLSRRIRKKGAMHPLDAIDLFVQICDGLSHAHKKGIVHRDLKPSNVVLCRDEDNKLEAKLVDFGIAKIVSDGAAESEKGGPALTRTGEVLGSPPYMSPEQCKGSAMDARSDIYSFGCLMFEVLTEKPPFMGDNFMEVVFKHMEEPPPTLRSVVEGNFPPSLEAVVAKCLAKPKADRFQSIDEVKSALLKAREDVINPHRAQNARLFTILGGIAGGGILLAAGVYFGMQWMQPKPAQSINKPLDFRIEMTAAERRRATAEAFSKQIRNGELVLEKDRSVTDDDMLIIATQPEFQNLRALDLSYTNITSEGVKHLKQSKAPLESLDLQNAVNVDDDAIEGITHFPLTYLNIQLTGMSDASLHQIAQMKTLKDLQLARIVLSSQSLKEIAALPNLETIDLTQIPLWKPEWTNILSRMKKLRSLDLEELDIGDSLAALGQMQSLSYLGLKQVTARPGFLTSLPRLPMLSEVNLTNDKQVTRADIEALANLPMLTELNLNGTEVGDEELKPLLKCKRLQVLKLSQTPVTVSGIKMLKALPNLSEIDLTGSGLSSKELDKLVADMAPVRIVD